MFKPNPNFKMEINKKALEENLTNMLEKYVYENGCTLCKGKNLTVYVNECTDTYIDGYAYCHDCNEKIPAHLDIDIKGEMEKNVKKLIKNIKR